MALEGKEMMKEIQALLIVDVQNDFCPGGQLPVPEGDKIVRVLNRYITHFIARGLSILASRDWHPTQTAHFQQFGGPWPQHCVQGTLGAQFHPGLSLTDNAIIISKGMQPDQDSYSAFLGQDSRGRALLDILKDLQITELYIGGLATDFCVKHSVLDALANGLKVKLLVDAIRGIDAQNIQAAHKEMRAAGVEETNFSGVVNLLGQS